jgi:hypothetical protein
MSSALTEEEEDVCMLFMDKISSNNKTLNARFLARVISQSLLNRFG